MKLNKNPEIKNKKSVDERIDEVKVWATTWLIKYAKKGDTLVRMSQAKPGSEAEKIERFPIGE